MSQISKSVFSYFHYSSMQGVNVFILCISFSDNHIKTKLTAKRWLMEQTLQLFNLTSVHNVTLSNVLPQSKKVAFFCNSFADFSVFERGYVFAITRTHTLLLPVFFMLVSFKPIIVVKFINPCHILFIPWYNMLHKTCIQTSHFKNIHIRTSTPSTRKQDSQ